MPRRLRYLRPLHAPMPLRCSSAISSTWLLLGSAICSLAPDARHCPSCTVPSRALLLNHASLSLTYFWSTL
uniref:Uncharacterized protein n=1 Tax=Arundo donax TaxID=35708 RepID=A0A0A8XTS5_ARUDO